MKILCVDDCARGARRGGVPDFGTPTDVGAVIILMLGNGDSERISIKPEVTQPSQDLSVDDSILF